MVKKSTGVDLPKKVVVLPTQDENTEKEPLQTIAKGRDRGRRIVAPGKSQIKTPLQTIGEDHSNGDGDDDGNPS